MLFGSKSAVETEVETDQDQLSKFHSAVKFPELTPEILSDSLNGLVLAVKLNSRREITFFLKRLPSYSQLNSEAKQKLRECFRSAIKANQSESWFIDNFLYSRQEEHRNCEMPSQVVIDEYIEAKKHICEPMAERLEARIFKYSTEELSDPLVYPSLARGLDFLIDAYVEAKHRENEQATKESSSRFVYRRPNERSEKQLYLDLIKLFLTHLPALGGLKEEEQQKVNNAFKKAIAERETDVIKEFLKDTAKIPEIEIVRGLCQAFVGGHEPTTVIVGKALQGVNKSIVDNEACSALLNALNVKTLSPKMGCYVSFILRLLPPFNELTAEQQALLVSCFKRHLTKDAGKNCDGYFDQEGICQVKIPQGDVLNVISELLTNWLCSLSTVKNLISTLVAIERFEDENLPVVISVIKALIKSGRYDSKLCDLVEKHQASLSSYLSELGDTCAIHQTSFSLQAFILKILSKSLSAQERYHLCIRWISYDKTEMLMDSSLITHHLKKIVNSSLEELPKWSCEPALIVFQIIGAKNEFCKMIKGYRDHFNDSHASDFLNERLAYALLNNQCEFIAVLMETGDNQLRPALKEHKLSPNLDLFKTVISGGFFTLMPYLLDTEFTDKTMKKILNPAFIFAAENGKEEMTVALFHKLNKIDSHFARGTDALIAAVKSKRSHVVKRLLLLLPISFDGKIECIKKHASEEYLPEAMNIIQFGAAFEEVQAKLRQSISVDSDTNNFLEEMTKSLQDMNLKQKSFTPQLMTTLKGFQWKSAIVERHQPNERNSL